MKTLIVILRLLSLGIFLVGCLNIIASYLSLSRLFFNFENFVSLLYMFMQTLALTLLCLAAASGLTMLRKMNEQIARASRRPVTPQTKDFAPVAPNWSATLDPPRQEVTPGFRPQRRIDGYNIGAPKVREAPPAIRVTPGAENQYADDDPLVQRAAYQARPEQRPTKEMLRLARDAQIRRQQQGTDK